MRSVSCFTGLLFFAGCLSASDSAPPPTASESPKPTPDTAASTAYFNGTLPAGSFRSGDYSRVQRLTHPLVVANGTRSIVATLTFTAQAGDLDFHFEWPHSDGESPFFGQDTGHRGSTLSPMGGTITVNETNARPGNWTLIVHTCEAEPACLNAEARFSVMLETTARRDASDSPPVSRT